MAISSHRHTGNATASTIYSFDCKLSGSNARFYPVRKTDTIQFEDKFRLFRCEIVKNYFSFHMLDIFFIN